MALRTTGFNQKNNHRAGFTLIELVLYVSLLTVVVSIVGEVTTLFRKVQTKASVVAEVEHQGWFVADTIAAAVRNSSGVTSPGLGASGSTLTLATGSGPTNPTVFDLDVVSGSLRVNYAGSGATALTSSRVVVSSVTFTNLGNTGTSGSIRAQFTLTYRTTTASRQELSYAKTFYVSASKR